MNPIGKTYTSPQGAIAQLNQTTAGKYGTTVAAPPQGVQPTVTSGIQPTAPTTDQTQQIAPITPLYQQNRNAPDTQALASARAQMIDELFNHDQGLAQKYNDPNSPDYIANPLKAQQIADMPMQADMGLVNTLNSLLKTQTNAQLPPAEQKQYYTNMLMADVSNLGANPKMLPEIVAKYRPYLTTNDIVDAYSTTVPNSGLTLGEAMQMGYKPEAAHSTALKNYQQAQTALQEIDNLDKQAQQANSFHSIAYAIPNIAQMMGGIDPAASYENGRMALASDLTKLIISSVFQGPSENISQYVPHAWDNQATRDFKLNQLRQMAVSRMQSAQEEVPQFALGSGSPTNVTNVAAVPTGLEQQPTQTAMAPIVTSSGNQFIITPAMENTAMAQ